MEDSSEILEGTEIKPVWDFGIQIKSEPGADDDDICDREQLCITDEINIKDEPLFKDEVVIEDEILITDEIHIKDEITLEHEGQRAGIPLLRSFKEPSQPIPTRDGLDTIGTINSSVKRKYSEVFKKCGTEGCVGLSQNCGYYTAHEDTFCGQKCPAEGCYVATVLNMVGILSGSYVKWKVALNWLLKMATVLNMIITDDHPDKESDPQHSAKNSLDHIKVGRHDTVIKIVPSNRKCKVEDCSKYAKKGGRCLKHGGTDIPKRCKSEDCPKLAMRGGYCVPHGGTEYRRRCQLEDCSKLAVKDVKLEPNDSSDTEEALLPIECVKVESEWDSEYRVKFEPCKDNEICFKEETDHIVKEEIDIKDEIILEDEIITGDYPDKESDPQHSAKDSLDHIKVGRHDTVIKIVPSNRKCKVEDCSKYAKKGGRCLKHGGTDIPKRCKSEDCPKLAMRGGYCVPHGGTEYRKRCQVEDCSKLAVKGGRCVAHGGTAYHKKSCQAEDCSKPPRKGGYCMLHGANALVVLSSTAEDGEIKVRILVG
uniref:WRKY19-like zinc finger domain-containing protein n=1 Tax=Timema genevievae TaxID=629358 RepID=A0A7R9K5N4_TIMGE|nr:unnamed protein product [Timema genevievae]